MRRRTSLAAAIVTAAALTGALGGPALASSTAPVVKAAPAMKKELGAAGYLVTLAKSATSVTTKTVITVPKSTCGSGFYSPAVAAEYTSGVSVLGASVELSLGCFGKVKAYGDAVLTVGSKTKASKKPLKAGTKVTITVTVTK